MNQLRLSLAVISLAAAVLLSGCVTETIGPQKKKVNPQEVVEKLVDLGVGYLQQGNYVRAKDNLRRALDIDPKSPRVHNIPSGIFFG